MRQVLKPLVLVSMLLMLTACAALGLATAKTFNERLVYGNATATGLMRGTTASLNAKRIESSDARYVLGVADQSSALLDAAETAASAGDTKTAEGRLTLALSVLDQLDAYLQEQERKAEVKNRRPTNE